MRLDVFFLFFLKNPQNLNERIIKTMKFARLVFIFSLIIASNCVCGYNHIKKDFLNSQQSILPVTSFVQVAKTIEIKVCPEVDACLILNLGTLGSGAIIEKVNTGFFVLTADHVCEIPDLIPDEFRSISTIDVKLFVKDFNNKEIKAFTFKQENFNDMCILYANKTTDFPKITMSTIAPKIGDKVFNISAPGGIFSAQMVPMYEGFYSGETIMKNRALAVYSIHAYPGSSGSMVLNHKGELIGMIHSGFAAVNTISLSPTYDILKDFIFSSLREIKLLTSS